MDVSSVFSFAREVSPKDLFQKGAMRRKKISSELEDFEFMDEVEAAFRSRGSRAAVYGAFLLTFLFCAFLLWSCVATRDEVTRGDGQVIPSLGIQPIQTPETGFINKIFVQANQEVKTGDLLVSMSNVETAAGYQDMLNKQVEYRLALKRLAAEAARRELVFTAEERAAYPQVVADQERLFQTRREKYEGDGRELAASLEQKRNAAREAQAQTRQAEEKLLLLKQQAEMVEPLVRRGVYPEMDYLRIKQNMVTQEGELNNMAETLSRILIEVKEEETRYNERNMVWDTAVAEETNEYRRQLDTIEERLKAGSFAMQNRDLRAPMPGIVTRVILKEGSVAQRAETILELLPTEDILEIEARFRPPDRSYLDVGQNASISVTAYESSLYGTLPARLISISPDTIEDSRGQTWYMVRLRTNSSRIVHEGEELEIKAGMTVTVDVISGKKTVFDYLLKPILKSRQEGRAGKRFGNATGQGPPPALPSVLAAGSPGRPEGPGAFKARGAL
ncbi:MAG: HlyD family type I secretion periplasmic adaptor subunit [Desulfovibrio sp.]|jgi:adhesin transport system membrane fusion protein|nr:HlyD family type I secretion periplasmic adaptor subunit [Desulfovibrio sp.]